MSQLNKELVARLEAQAATTWGLDADEIAQLDAAQAALTGGESGE